MRNEWANYSRARRHRLTPRRNLQKFRVHFLFMNTLVTSASVGGPRDGVLRDDIPQFAFAGRSNVGKSRLVNALMRQKLARTSAAAGKTRQANIFQMTVSGGQGHPGTLERLPRRSAGLRLRSRWARVSQRTGGGRRSLFRRRTMAGCGQSGARDATARRDFSAGRFAASRPGVGHRGLPVDRDERRDAACHRDEGRQAFARRAHAEPPRDRRRVRTDAVGGVERHRRRPRRPAASDGQPGQAGGHPSFVTSAWFTNQVLAQLELHQPAKQIGLLMLRRSSTRNVYRRANRESASPK